MVSVLILISCNDIQPKKTEKIGDATVSLLFEKDGIKVYRFEDGGRWHYFTTLGETITTQSSGGKNQTYWEENISINQK